MPNTASLGDLPPPHSFGSYQCHIPDQPPPPAYPLPPAYPAARPPAPLRSLQLVEAAKSSGAVMGDRSKLKKLITPVHISDWKATPAAKAAVAVLSAPATAAEPAPALAGAQKSGSWRDKQEPTWAPPSHDDDGTSWKSRKGGLVRQLPAQFPPF